MRIAVWAAALISAAISSWAGAARAGAAPEFAPVPCRDPAWVDARCGTVRTPEDRTRPDGRTIDIYVAVLPSLDGPATKTPVYDIVGGPGDPATIRIPGYLTARRDYRRGREIVLIEQRGTGASNPLVCSQFSGPADLQSRLRPLYDRAEVAACAAELSVRADLSRYVTRELVRDTEAVRAALGHEKIDLLAASYGTTLALQYLKAHPERVRSAVLIGAVPAFAAPPRWHAKAGKQALDALFADCAADPACARAFPSPRSDLKAALARLERGEPAGGPRIAPEVFMERLRSLMYRAAGARRVPLILNRAARGDFGPFLALYEGGGGPEVDPFADGLYLSITCAESFGRFDYASAARAARRTPFGDYRLRQQRAACEVWPRGEIAQDHFRPVRADTAVLFLSGRIDSVAPPQWAAEAARGLPNSRHIVMAPAGHALTGTPGLETCIDPLIVRALDAGSMKDLDAACIADLKGPPFPTGGG